jgi:hypothetical protein
METNIYILIRKKSQKGGFVVTLNNYDSFDRKP